jgi:structure-specific endonuclease subunit SLX1
MTRHISPNSRLTNGRTTVRISPKTGRVRKRRGRPTLSLTDRLANLHLLLCSNSFQRWPLNVTFYSVDVFRVWQKWTAQPDVEEVRSGILIELDQSSHENARDQNTTTNDATGIHALDVTYAPVKPYLEKTKALLERDVIHNCTICHSSLPREGHATLFCPNPSCSAVGHIECFSNHFLKSDKEAMIPITASCPSCKSKLHWIDLVEELSLRMRGEKEVEKMFKSRKPRARKNGKVESTAVVPAQEPESSSSEDEDDLGEDWHVLSESENDAPAKVARTEAGPAFKMPRSFALPTAYAEPEPIVEDSEWDDAMVLT